MKKLLIIFLAVIAIAAASVLYLENESTGTNWLASIFGLSLRNKPVSVLFAGDIMLGRNVENLMNKYGETHPFELVAGLLYGSDFAIANLEGPVMKNHIKTPSMSFRFSFEDSVPRLLFENNIQLVSLANNHLYDYGKAGYDETISNLKNVGVDFVGHPYSLNQAYVTREKIGSRNFIFFAANATNPNLTSAEVVDAIKKIERQDGDILVALIHGGDEYVLTSNSAQKKMYRAVIDAGADLVIAHHPHVVEEIESYKGKLIFYSLGNFIFDQYFSKDVEQGLVVKASFNKDSAIFQLIPIQGNHSRPMLMNEDGKASFLKSLAERSSKSLASSIIEGEIVSTTTVRQ